MRLNLVVWWIFEFYDYWLVRSNLVKVRSTRVILDFLLSNHQIVHPIFDWDKSIISYNSWNFKMKMKFLEFLKFKLEFLVVNWGELNTILSQHSSLQYRFWERAIGDYCFILTLEAQNFPPIQPPPYIPRKMRTIQTFLQNILQTVDVESDYWWIKKWYYLWV